MMLSFFLPPAAAGFIALDGGAAAKGVLLGVYPNA